MDSGGRCHTSDVLGEGDGRPIDQFGTLGEPDRPPGSPVHGDGMIWVNKPDRLCRLLRVQMALTESGPPASDWHEGDVFCVPSWAWHEHANGSVTDDAVLFSYNDFPVMRSLAFWREEAYPDDNGHQTVE